MAWQPTYYAIQLNDPEQDVIVLVPSFGIFTDADKAQGEADGYNRACPGKLHYTVVPVNIIAIEPAFTANEVREAFHAKG